MFLQEDIETIQRLTHLTEEQVTSNSELEKEYMIRLRFYHLDGNRGPLKGVHLIDCLRHVGLTPPEAPKPKAVKQPVNWNDVPTQDENGMPTKVIVTKKVSNGRKVEEHKLLGDYLGMFDMGRLAIRFGNNPLVEEFSAGQVELAPSVLPTDVKTEGEEFVVTANDAQEFQEAVEEQVTARAKTGKPQGDPADPTGWWEPPALNGEWVGHEGEPVIVDYRGETREGRLVDVGPGDHKLTILFTDNGESKVISEDKVQLV